MIELALSPDTGRGLGLMGMQERIDILDGEIEFISATGYGTRVYVRVPLVDRTETCA